MLRKNLFILNLQKFFKFFCTVAAFTAAVAFAVSFPVSCSLTDHGVEIADNDTAGPEFVEYSMKSKNELSILCSGQVSAAEISVTKEGGEENSSIQTNAPRYEENETGTEVVIEFAEDTKAGEKYCVSGNVADTAGNTNEFSFTVPGFNENPAVVILNEVRTTHNKSKEGLLKKTEFIELFVVKGGNLAGLEVVAGGEEEKSKYELPAIEVETGEFIVVHYGAESEGYCVDETGSDKNLSTTESSSENARDLWVLMEEYKACIGNKSDVILLRDAYSGRIFDALLYSDKTDRKDETYTGVLQKEFAENSFKNGIWKDGFTYEYTLNAEKTTYNRTLGRTNTEEILLLVENAEDAHSLVIPSGKDDWAVFTKGTPGTENSTEIYMEE